MLSAWRCCVWAWRRPSLRKTQPKLIPSITPSVSENAYSRIVKAHYGPHEKSVMHAHPDLVAVFLTDGKVKFTYPGKTEERTVKAGDAMFTPATVHLPENTGDQAFDVILVEFKGKAKTTAKPTTKPAPKAEGKK